MYALSVHNIFQSKNSNIIFIFLWLNRFDAAIHIVHRPAFIVYDCQLIDRQFPLFNISFKV